MFAANFAAIDKHDPFHSQTSPLLPARTGASCLPRHLSGHILRKASCLPGRPAEDKELCPAAATNNINDAHLRPGRIIDGQITQGKTFAGGLQWRQSGDKHQEDIIEPRAQDIDRRRIHEYQR